MDKLAKRITLGLTAMLVAMPLAAQAALPMDLATQEMNDSIAQEKSKERVQDMLPLGGGQQTQSRPINDTPSNAPLPPQAPEAPAEPENVIHDERLAPYIGKTVTKISITGNKVVPEAAVLNVVNTKPGMEFSETGLSEDLSAIYEMGWFYDLRPEFTVVPEGVQVTYHVLENPVYKGYEVTGNTVIKKDKVAECFASIPKEELANLKTINKAVQALESVYRAEGYILAKVANVEMAPDGTLKVDVTEGKVEGFKVKGNKKCKDYVITREMRLKVGEPFNAKKARRSMQRIYNLGYFEDVNVKLNPGREPGSIEVQITVVEMNTGTFGIGAGYSSADGFVGMISLGDKNFRGIGDSINIRWEFGGRDNKNYDFTYTRPWLDKRETAATIRLYDITNTVADYNIDDQELARYDRKRRGQELTLSRKADDEFITNYITLKNRNDIYEGPRSGYENDTQYYEPSFDNSPLNKPQYNYPKTAAARREENFGTTRSITLGRYLDSRDNIYDPREGKRIGYYVEQSGLGGDFRFTKVEGNWRYYYKSGKNNVWALNLGAGYASGDMPLSQRFKMGGSDTLRGYEDDQFRGNSMVKATLEYRFPIIKKIEGVLFTDNGYAWDKRFEDKFKFGDIKTSYGLGLRINSPLGPLKFDYGWRRGGGGKFHFSFGGQF